MHQQQHQNIITSNLSIPTISNLSVCFTLCCNHHQTNTLLNPELKNSNEMKKKNQLLFLQPHDDDQLKTESSSSMDKKQHYLPSELAECIINCSQTRKQAISMLLGLNDETSQ
ncbi:hypothetical protein C9374_009353 [Naegleria lovaniensis]|uniref:Uncharacterized protein n=1 Tax=Naegleria lovaniensis TaxID=51637 RepID=A0AA88KEE4_NAELO|nr:uncharacterized protein C9374_009353 [Naegleria lovaniensis]KAG2377442.1 hypothetical protein C9374_009353 [Naegleria lovaniensis]